MADRKATLTAILVDGVSGPGKQIQATVTGIGSSVSKMQALLTGIGVGIGEEIFSKLTDAVGELAHALPELIGMGNEYLDQLHQIQLETGLTAEQASVLVGVTKSLGISTDNLEPLFAKLGKSLSTNEGNFRALGVATRDSNNNMLGAFQIIQNLREQVSKHGEGLLSTAAAQALFGRGGYQLLPLLQMTSDQFRESAQNVERWGGVMSQQAIDGAHKFGVALASLQTGILDIGTNIFAALSPYLTAFVDAFSQFVQAHLQEIINFAVAVAAAITGFIGGLLGFTVDFSKVGDAGEKAAAGTDTFGKAAKAATAGQDAFTTAVNAHIKAIDAQIAAETRASQLRAAARERERLDMSLAAAQRQLADLRGNAPFLGGLSGGEQALAIQKHAQDIIDAEKNVHDARQSLGDFEADQKDQAERQLLEREKQRLQDSLAAHKTANAAILDSGLQMNTTLQKSANDTFKNIGVDVASFQKTAQDAFKAGSDAANAFLNILLGTPSVDASTGALGPRKGGVVGAIEDLATGIGHLFDAVGGINAIWDDFWRGWHFLIWILGQVDQATQDATVAIRNFLTDLFNSIYDAIASIPGLGAAFPKHSTGGGGGFAGGGWVGLHGPQLALVGEQGPEYIVPNHALGSIGGGQVIHTHVYLDGREITEVVSKRLAYDLQHAPVTSKPFGAF